MTSNNECKPYLPLWWSCVMPQKHSTLNQSRGNFVTQAFQKNQSKIRRRLTFTTFFVPEKCCKNAKIFISFDVAYCLSQTQPTSELYHTNKLQLSKVGEMPQNLNFRSTFNISRQNSVDKHSNSSECTQR